MSQVKGVVMRVSGKKTVVYTQEGDFLEIPTPQGIPRVGQTIKVRRKSSPFTFKQLYRYATVAAILVLVLALGLLNPLLGPNVAVASVALDINSGLELYVDKDSKIVEVKGASGPLKEVVEKLPLQNANLYQAVNLILKEARAENVLLEDNNFVLASVIPIDDQGKKAIDENKLRNTIREAMVSKNISGVVMVGNTDQDTKRKAEQMGLNVNRYLVYEHCQQDGVQIHADELRQGDLQQVLANKKVSLPTLFPEDYFEVKHGDHTGSTSTKGITPQASEHRQAAPSSAPQNQSAPDSEHKVTKQGTSHNSSSSSSGETPQMQQHQSSGSSEHKTAPVTVPTAAPAQAHSADESAGMSHEVQNNHD